MDVTQLLEQVGVGRALMTSRPYCADGAGAVSLPEAIPGRDIRSDVVFSVRTNAMLSKMSLDDMAVRTRPVLVTNWRLSP